MDESLSLENKQLLRNNEYYDIKNIFDEMYLKVGNNYEFVDLMDYIYSHKNILLAYRDIKTNKGSTTVGTDNREIRYFRNMNQNNL